MKKTFLAGLALAMGALLTGACSSNSENYEDDRIWDFAPIVYQIEVENAAGQDMLDPLNNGNLLGRISVAYKGETYRPDLQILDDATASSAPTRAYMPHFSGLTLERCFDRETQQYKGYYLEFGEFDGAADAENEVTLVLEPMPIVSPDDELAPAVSRASGTNSEYAGQLLNLRFTNRLTWHISGNPIIDRHFYLDGAEHDGAVYRFVYDAPSQRLVLKD